MNLHLVFLNKDISRIPNGFYLHFIELFIMRILGNKVYSVIINFRCVHFKAIGGKLHFCVVYTFLLV